MTAQAALVAQKLRTAGIRAVSLSNTRHYAPPADLSPQGILRIHTGPRAEIEDLNLEHKQAILRPRRGVYANERFLVGMDETSNFVCRLPRYTRRFNYKVTVKNAHEMLRPRGLMPHTIRQGEWFFVRVTKKGRCEACGELLLKHWNQRTDASLGGTSHHASRMVRCSGRTFVRDTIRDDREGHHADVELGNVWHEVYHNTEEGLLQEPRSARVYYGD